MSILTFEPISGSKFRFLNINQLVECIIYISELDNNSLHEADQTSKKAQLWPTPTTSSEYPEAKVEKLYSYVGR